MSDSLKAVLCLGSNTVAREQIISRALVRLENICHITAASRVYEAPDDSGLGDPYLNVVLVVTPRLSYEDFKSSLKQMETDFGRTSLSKSAGCMPLDVDIIIWDGEIVDRYQYSRGYFQRGYHELDADL